MRDIYAELGRNKNLKAVVFAMHWPRRYNEFGDEAAFVPQGALGGADGVVRDEDGLGDVVLGHLEHRGAALAGAEGVGGVSADGGLDGVAGG
mgnify:CR=1 FL=1